MRKAVILVGHGGVPTDFPAKKVSELKRLEAAGPSPAFAKLDDEIRRWPRTSRTDPYKTGLETVADALRAALPEHLVVEAYNEFCAPSLEQAIESVVKRGSRQVVVISTMFTRGGIHSEAEIPEILERERRRHPGVDIRYAWPFELPDVAALLAGQVQRAQAGQRAI